MKFLSRHIRMLTIGAGLFAAGCSSPLIGDWSTGIVANGRRSEMTLDAEGTGDATIIAIIRIEGDSYMVEETFDIRWEESGADYELDMECTGSDIYGASCSRSDFTMDCELRGDDDELECTGDKTYANYEFRWELD